MLENLSTRLQGIFSGLRGKGRLTEDDINDAMREIRMALLEADVNFKVVKSFVARTKERCLDAEVLDSLTPAQNVIKIVLDELTELLGRTDSKLVLSSRIPNVIMLVGLQGSGKTTAAAKLAYRLKQENHSPLLVACDVYRPAAADQLETLGGEIGVRVYRGDGQDPVKIAQEGIQDAIDNLRDVVIVDTAGRLHVDDEMMDEAENIKRAVKPDQILMVVDAMTGQDVVNVASAFSQRVDFDGVIMSKMDGDARGGGALSIKQVTGKPIKFISSGEKPDSLEEFHPDRMAKRILGMGDVVSLIESAVKVQQEEVEQEQAERMMRANLTLNDFIDMNRQIRKMGGVSKLLSALPGGDKAMAAGQVDENAFDHMEVIINSMSRPSARSRAVERLAPCAHRGRCRRERLGREPAHEEVQRDEEDDEEDDACRGGDAGRQEGEEGEERPQAPHGTARRHGRHEHGRPQEAPGHAGRVAVRPRRIDRARGSARVLLAHTQRKEAHMALEIRPYREEDLAGMIKVWNEVVEAGEAFPQVEPLTMETARAFFAEQTLTTVAAIDDKLFGLYILHPNNEGRCVHVANASYAVASSARGLGLGRELVKDSLSQAARKGFRGLQFNAVVASNEAAIHLYEDLGFTRVGTIPGGFCSILGNFEDMHIYYKDCFGAALPS